MSTTVGGVRIVDMPDLGAANDSSSVVAERAGSGRFSMPAVRSYVQTGLTYTAPGTGGVSRAMSAKLAERLSVKDYGAVGDGATDDTTAIQAAMDAGAALGGARIIFPVGNYRITASLNIGNGTASAVSTKAGVVLVGEGAPPITGFWSGFTLHGSAQITWAGGAAPIINVNGPIQGWGVQGLALMGASVATVGIQVTSGQFGDCQNVLVSGCLTRAIGSTTVAPIGGGDPATTNSIHNSWRNIAIAMPVSSGGIGIVLTGIGPAVSSDTCCNLFENIFIGLPSSGTGYGLYLQNCDTNQFMGVHLAGGTSSCTGVMLDYTAITGAIWPSANSFFGMETNGAVLGNLQFNNSGTPSINARPNYIRGMDLDNSSTNPSLANLLPDLPVVFPPNVFLNNQSTSLSGGLAIPYEAGLYRISVYCAIMTLGNAVTVTASVGWNDGASRTASTLPINMSTGTNNPQSLVLSVFSVANLGFTYSTSVSGAIGAGLYRLAIVVERLT